MPNDLTKEERERLRERMQHWPTQITPEMNVGQALALLDAADERDQLAGEVERLNARDHELLSHAEDELTKVNDRQAKMIDQQAARIAELERAIRLAFPIIDAVRLNDGNDLTQGERRELDFQRHELEAALDGQKEQ